MPAKKESLVFKVQVFFEKEEGGGYHTYAPALKGLHSCGSTLEEAKRNTSEALIAYITSLIKHGDPIPLTCIQNVEPRAPKKTVPPHRQEFLQVSV